MSRIAITGLLLNNVRDFGAKGDGVTDDRAAIQAAIDDAVAQGRGGIFVPEGTFSVSLSVANQASLRLSGVSNLRIAGTGTKSIIKLATQAAGGVSWAMFRLDGVTSKIYFDNLTLDGNRAGVTTPSALTRLIFTESTVLDVDVDRVLFTGSPAIGAGIDGTRVAVRNCRFTDHATIGVEIRDVLKSCLVQGCFFFSNVLLDLQVQPTVAITNSTDITIDDCFFDKGGTAQCLFVGGAGAATGPNRLRITNSVFLGTVLISEAPMLSFCDNFCDASVGTVVRFDQIAQDVLVANNSIRSTSGTALFLGAGAGLSPDNIRICNNLIVVASAAVGLLCSGGTNVSINDNEILAFPGGTSSSAMDLGTLEAQSNIEVRDNDCMGTFTSTAINFSALAGGRSYDEIMVVGNRIQGTNANALLFSAGGGGVYNKIPVIIGNLIDQASLLGVGSFANFPVPAVIIGGAGAVGAGASSANNACTQFMGTGTPEGVIRGSRGDTFQRVDGGIGTTFYIKQTGDSTTTLWTAVGGITGLYSPPEKWNQNDIAASQTNVALETLVSANFSSIQMIRSGSIVGMSTRFSAALAAGQATLTVTKNGAAGTLAVVSTNASNASGGTATQAAGIDTYVAGDQIGVQITTTGAFAPTTDDVESWLQFFE